jgi:hypothetical protein
MTRAALIARVRDLTGVAPEVVEQQARIWQEPEPWVREWFHQGHVKVLVGMIGA